jgi:plasmid stabilization system protein ParE
MSSYNIIWSPKAKITYYQVLEYLELNWTIKEIKSFINRTDYVIEHISQTPFHYPYSLKGDTYKCVPIKQVSLFYRIKQQEIELLLFWDNRQNPAKLIL